MTPSFGLDKLHAIFSDCFSSLTSVLNLLKYDERRGRKVDKDNEQ